MKTEENSKGYFTKRIFCRKEEPNDIKTVSRISRMLYDYNKKKFGNVNGDGNSIEGIIVDHAYSLTVSLSSKSRYFFVRGLFRMDKTKKYQKPIGFAMGSFDHTFGFAILNSLYIDEEYYSEYGEKILVDAFFFWSNLMKAKRMFIERCSDENNVISKLVEIKKEPENAGDKIT